MKRLAMFFAVIIIAGCGIPTESGEGKTRNITPPRENLKLTLIEITEKTSEIFVELKNGPYGGKEPKFYFLIGKEDENGIKGNKEYWTYLYKEGWIDSGKVWLKDELQTIEPNSMVYTDLNFDFPARPEQIVYFWISVTE